MLGFEVCALLSIVRLARIITNAPKIGEIWVQLCAYMVAQTVRSLTERTVNETLEDAVIDIGHIAFIECLVMVVGQWAAAENMLVWMGYTNAKWQPAAADDLFDGFEFDGDEYEVESINDEHEELSGDEQEFEWI
ncbi:unnamed protein product [Caenorhabditis bovis]|uniref:Bestrophin homolog n=1 Tax=Caenorhabditis bovis TaxID=2654633 RepID=A0A8S1F0V5_9PELO|nr:unnamed protein product [Caenorhabditis bovis]